VVYLAWLVPDRPVRRLRGPCLLALSGPVLWAVSDLVVTGNHADLLAAAGEPLIVRNRSWLAYAVC
jgi:hypothetical protein